MHIFTIAGHETTATSLRFTLLFLALHPDVQNCLHEGILEPTRGEPEDVAHWDYHRMFPKLITRVMLEVLRLYPPVVTVPKSTSETPSPLSTFYRRESTSTSTQIASIIRKHTGAQMLQRFILKDGMQETRTAF
jgi:hypothetical protein